jgi:site-specific recombinase XerD
MSKIINIASDKSLFFSLTFNFLEIYLPRQCGKSKCTVENYRDSLSLFRKFLFEQKKISIEQFSFCQCTRELVLEFLDFVTGRGCLTSTRNQRLTALKSYLRFVAETNISMQPIAFVVCNIKYSTTPEPLRICMSNEVVTAILSQPDTSTQIGVRDSTMMVLLYDSAIRLSELLDLRIGNVTVDDNPYIRVMGKGSKERIVPICDNSAAHLKRYLKIYRGVDITVTDLVFYSNIKGKVGKMTGRNVQKFIQKYADMARQNCKSVPVNVHPHMFRRARATSLYQEGTPLPLVSRVLGHRNIDTTKIYAKPSIDMMRKSMAAAAHPEITVGEEPLWKKEESVAKSCGLR